MVRTEFEKKYISARRKAISLDFAHLNSVQREAVMTTQGPLLLLAGAGSGKTTVLICRIANLINYGCGSDSEYVPEYATEDDLAYLENYASNGIRNSEFGIRNFSLDEDWARLHELCSVDPVPPWRIIAITFTNKAAGEMKQRLSKMLGNSADDVWASTFHSACVRILRRDIDRLGYDRSFAIYDTSDAASLMKRILKEQNIEERNLPHKTVLGYISRAKDAMITADDFLASAEKTGDMRRIMIGRAYLEYENRMKSSNALDFDDLILLTVRLFKENPDVLEHYQSRFKYVLVDEYQDTNNLQYLLASSLAGGRNNICVVGDDDQSIYKFRGATIENILSFEKKFTDAQVIRLEQKYRSTSCILNAANDVIRNNRNRKGKSLWTENEYGEKPELYITADERAEAQFVADKIIASAAEGRAWIEHVVLYRMNAQSNQLETAFKRYGIPYRIFGGTGFYERAEIKDMLAYLCIIHNPHDDVRLLRVINNPPRGIGNTTIDRLTAIATEMGSPVFEIIAESHKYDELKAPAGRLHQFSDMIAELHELSETLPLDELYDTLISRTGYIRMLEEKGSDENLARIENVRELKTNILSFMNESDGSLFDFLSETALFTDLDRDNQGSDRVLMMTMHSAKGLEFDTVFIVGAEEGIFPGIRSIGDPEDIEEERRLCYVAMTRAMRRLYFTSAQYRMLFGKTSSAQPSRFIREISNNYIDVHEPRGKFQSLNFVIDDDQPIFNSGARSQKPPSYSSSIKSGYRTPNSDFSSTPWSHSSSSSTTFSSSATASNDMQTFNIGDTINHKAFGCGVITGISPAGGDALLEIAFDKEGTKRMLLKSASRYISKVNSEFGIRNSELSKS